MKVTHFYNFLFGFFSKTRAPGGVKCRKGCQGIPINLHMLKDCGSTVPQDSADLCLPIVGTAPSTNCHITVATPAFSRFLAAKFLESFIVHHGTGSH